MQVFDEEAEEELLVLPDFVRFFPFFRLPEGLETKRAELSSISVVLISISRCFTSAYDKPSFVVSFSITFLWFVTKEPNKKSRLAICLLRNVAKVVWYESEDAFESFVRCSHWDSNLDTHPGKSVPDYWVGREARFIIWETRGKAKSL